MPRDFSGADFLEGSHLKRSGSCSAPWIDLSLKHFK